MAEYEGTVTVQVVLPLKGYEADSEADVVDGVAKDLHDSVQQFLLAASEVEGIDIAKGIGAGDGTPENPTVLVPEGDFDIEWDCEVQVAEREVSLNITSLVTVRKTWSGQFCLRGEMDFEGDVSDDNEVQSFLEALAEDSHWVQDNLEEDRWSSEEEHYEVESVDFEDV